MNTAISRDNNVFNILNEWTFPHSRHNNPLRARAYQPSSGVTSTCPQTKMNNYPADSGVSCDQYFEPHRHC